MSLPHKLRLSQGGPPCLASREAHSSRDPHTQGVRNLATAAAGTPAAASPAAAVAPPPTAGGYQLPPPEIKAIVDAPSEPLLSFSPDRTMLLELERPPPLPPVSELARPELKLAGLRIDPAAFGRSRMLSYYTSLRVAPFTDDLVLPLSAGLGRSITGIPEGYWINYVTWSPGGQYVAFCLRGAGGPGQPERGPFTLWVADVSTGAARQLTDRPLNTVFSSYDWVDDETLIASVVPEGTGPPPPTPPAPLGPRVEDNTEGRKSQSRTYPDLLKSTHDEALFEYYTSAELVSIQVATGELRPAGAARAYGAVAPSPDGRYLLVSWLERPFSYAVPCGRFPKRVQLWRRDGSLVRELAALPLAEEIPIAFDSCRMGPRGLEWRSDKPAEVSWTECQVSTCPCLHA